MTKDETIKMDQRVLTDADGQGVLITGLQLKEELRGTAGEYTVRLVVSGTANSYLSNPSDADGGTVPIDPIPVEEGIALDANDKTMFLSKLNRAFNIDPPLVDDGEEVLFRLTEGEDAYSQIVGKKAYFKCALKKGSEDSPYGPVLYYNLTTIPKRETSTKAAMQEKLKKLLAKKSGGGQTNANLDAILGS